MERSFTAMCRRFALPLVFCLVTFFAAGCREKPQPAETGTLGNATDRSTDGTTGTGEPRSPAQDTAAAATSLGTVGNSQAASSTAPAITGTTDVHAASNSTTGTLVTPTTTTVSVATPAGTTATVAQPKQP
jgi:hypothetical protein